MGLAEFDLIKRYFGGQQIRHPYNRLGIGDDCALVNLPATQQLAVTTDTMVENVHFFADVEPGALGHKLLAVNLSDLAAMSAEPFAVTLAIAMPKVDEDWLQAFADGFLKLAGEYQLDLIGGDTTSGPLTLTVQAMGAVPHGQAMLRSNAKIGDLVYVTGQIGNAGLGLKIMQGYVCGSPQCALNSFHKPQPRVAQGLSLRGVANSGIDISDGLAADLGHILELSGVGACLEWESLPLSREVCEYLEKTGDKYMPLLAGDDYELCFTVPAGQEKSVPDGCFCIGRIEAAPGLRLRQNGKTQIFSGKGYEHFS